MNKEPSSSMIPISRPCCQTFVYSRRVYHKYGDVLKQGRIGRNLRLSKTVLYRAALYYISKLYEFK